jgi:hypothetical protein
MRSSKADCANRQPITGDQQLLSMLLAFCKSSALQVIATTIMPTVSEKEMDLLMQLQKQQ